jgi:glycosyltransferase involved in cell wall biosynthesis
MRDARWQIVTGEYPPQDGGVSAYTRVLARGLAEAGDRVDVWAPRCTMQTTSSLSDPGVSVHRLPDHFGPRSLHYLSRQLDTLADPARLLVQYVPHAFGWKALNVPFCLWLQARHRLPVWIMFHEVAYPVGFDQSLPENALGVATRWMATIAGRAADRIFVSIPAWQPIVESLIGTRAPIVWLPVPSSVTPVDDPAGTAEVRSRVADGAPLVGHLGTYGRPIGRMLETSLRALLTMTDCRALLLGRQGDAFGERLIATHPEFADRVSAPGVLSDEDLSRHVAACDIMLQPYPDGVSSRRTSVMAALAHGRPVVTTLGRLSESLWSGTGAVVLAPAADAAALGEAASALLCDTPRWAEMSARGRAVYEARFALRHTIERLRGQSSLKSEVSSQV